MRGNLRQNIDSCPSVELEKVTSIGWRGVFVFTQFDLERTKSCPPENGRSLQLPRTGDGFVEASPSQFFGTERKPGFRRDRLLRLRRMAGDRFPFAAGLDKSIRGDHRARAMLALYQGIVGVLVSRDGRVVAIGANLEF